VGVAEPLMGWFDLAGLGRLFAAHLAPDPACGMDLTVVLLYLVVVLLPARWRRFVPRSVQAPLRDLLLGLPCQPSGVCLVGLRDCSWLVAKWLRCLAART